MLNAHTDFGVPLDGSDASSKFQAMLASLPNGAAVAIDPGLIGLGTVIDLSHNRGIRFVGQGGQNKNGGGPSRGMTFFKPLTPGMTMFKYDSGSVEHMGYVFEWCNFWSDLAGCRAHDYRDINSWRFDRCSWQGKFGGGALYLDIPSSTRPSGDNSYGSLQDCNWSMKDEGRPIWAKECGGMRVHGGYVDTPKGGFLLEKASDCHFLHGKTNCPGTLFTIKGAWNTIEWDMEQYNSDTQPAPIVEILHDDTLGVAWSGTQNRIVCTATSHPYAAAQFLHLGKGTEANVVDAFARYMKVVDEGVNNKVTIR